MGEKRRECAFVSFVCFLGLFSWFVFLEYSPYAWHYASFARGSSIKFAVFCKNFRSFRIVEVRGRVALVTGAGARIGRAMALYLARERGMRVAVHCRDSTQGAEAAVAEIVSLGGEACVFRADLSMREDSEALVSRVSEHFCDVVSVLVNNASVFERDEWDSVSGSQWSRHMSVNLEAAYVLSRSLGEELRKEMAKRGGAAKGGVAKREKKGVVEGVIVNMLDQRVLRLTPHYVSYSVSKFGLFGLTQILAQAMAPRVRVVGLGLGQVLAGKQEETQEGEKAGERAGKQEERQEGEGGSEEGEEDSFLRRVRSTPMGEAVSLGDVCGVLGLVLENDSLTGQTIAVDGGQHLG